MTRPWIVLMNSVAAAWRCRTAATASGPRSPGSLARSLGTTGCALPSSSHARPRRSVVVPMFAANAGDIRSSLRGKG